MHDGDIGPKAQLDSLVKRGIYAVGALDSLSGEVLIEDGQIMVSTFDQDTLKVDRVTSGYASLLVYSQVNSWKEIPVEGEKLEQSLLYYAKKNGISIPFPFMLKGAFKKLEYHIISFDPENGDLQNHKEGAFRSDLSNEEVVVLGFYSDRHHGVYTHHDANMHMHVRDNEFTRMGHVDVLEVGYKFTLLIPEL